VLGNAFSRDHLDYLGHLLVPLGFLFALSPVLLLAVLPEAALNVLSSNPYQSSAHFHYTAGLIAPLFVASVLGAAALVRRRPRLKPVVGPAVVVLAVLSNYWLGPVPVWAALPGGSTFQRNATHVTAHDRITARAVALVPGDAVVSATNSLGAHLSARRRILSFPRIDDATWVAVDETNGSYLDGTGPLPMEVDVAALRRDPGWRLAFEQDGVLVFRRLSAGPGKNRASPATYRSPAGAAAAGTPVRR
jgi:uncharacterized membrane protein